MDERCSLCGYEEERHYDGVQCPIGEEKYSATQMFTPTKPLETSKEKEGAR